MGNRRSLVLGLSVWLTGAVITAQAETQALVVDRIEDGDTLVVELNGKPERLQLLGIDAPEDTENAKLKRDVQITGLAAEELLPLGKSATAHLESLVSAGESVKVGGDLGQRDRYGRISVEVFDQAGRSLSEAMVEEGFAVVLRYGAVPDEIKARLTPLEAVAVEERRGLWGQQRQAAMAWAFRDSSPR